MGVVSSVARAYRRLRHSRGFGVHSPFAYEVVKMCIKPGSRYGWYGYEDIDASLPARGGYPRMRRDARLLLRLLSFLNPPRLAVSAGEDEIFRTVAEIAGIECREGRPAPGDFQLMRFSGNNDNTDNTNNTDNTDNTDNSFLAIDPPETLKRRLTLAREYGLLMTGRRLILYIANRDMVFTEYEMRF